MRDSRSFAVFRCHFLWVVFLLPCLLLAGCAKNPVSGEREIALMSEKEEIRLGERHYPILTQIYGGELRGERLQEYVSRIGHQLADVSHNPDLPFEFNVVNTSDHNAYALPGGKVTVTRGLLLEMDREAQLAAVLGHEIVHATARHTVQQRTQGIFANVLMTAGSIYLRSEGVSYAGLYEDLGRVGASALLASYGRSQEEQADRVGMRYVAKAGYDPQGMIELQEILLRLREREPDLVQQLFASHPLSEERIEYSRREKEEVLSEIDPPEGNQLNRFEPLVVDVWKPRRPAYERLDEGIGEMKENRIAAALESFREALEVYDGEPLFHAWEGAALTELDRLESGRESLDRALDRKADVYRIRLFSGINHLERERYRDSLEDLDRADELLPEMPDVFFYRGRNHEELGNRNRAAEQYVEYLRRVQRGEKAEYARKRLREWGY